MTTLTVESFAIKYGDDLKALNRQSQTELEKEYEHQKKRLTTLMDQKVKQRETERASELEALALDVQDKIKDHDATKTNESVTKLYQSCSTGNYYVYYRTKIQELIKHLDALKDPKVCSLAEKILVIKNTQDLIEGKLSVNEYALLAHHVQGRENILLQITGGMMMVLGFAVYFSSIAITAISNPTLFAIMFPVTLISGLAMMGAGSLLGGLNGEHGIARDISYLKNVAQGCQSQNKNHTVFFTHKQISDSASSFNSKEIHVVDMEALHPTDTSSGAAENALNIL